MGEHLQAVMLHGMTTAELRNLVLKPSRRFCAKRHVALHYSVCNASSADYWQTVQAHITQHGAGSIIIGVTGGYDHWTCVRRITDKTMLLADSVDWARLYRRHVTVGAGEAKYRLRSRDTFLMVIEK